MRQKGNRKTILMLFLLLWIPLSCNNEGDRQTYIRLQQWDNLLEGHPEAVLDSLRKLDPRRLSHAHRAYHGLLKTISEDKVYTEFTSDSLISEVERYYKGEQGNDYMHARSLIYQAIVRCRMNIFDSTVLSPLKEAEKVSVHLKKQDPCIGYLMNYYLGEVLTENLQSESAEIYYKKALDFVKYGGNRERRFDAYMALYWCKMIQDKFEEGKLYLDTLQQFSNLTSDQRYILYNALSSYYDTQKETIQSLEIKIKQKDLIPLLKQEKEIFRLYASISDRYKKLNELDSAMYYADLAIVSVVDTTYALNYLLYENIADIAEKQHAYKSANEYRKTGANLLRKNIRRETEAQIRELEKKYALSEMKNEALKAKQYSRQLLFLLIIVLLVLVLQYLYISKQKSIQRLNKERHKAEIHETILRKESAEAKALYIQKQNDFQQQILSIYSLFIQHFRNQNQQIITIATSLRSKNPLIADKLDLQLKENQKLIAELTAQHFTPGKIKDLLDLADTPHYLNNSECLILYMLSSNVENTQIAALLNTSNSSFKARKNQLKRKIFQKVNDPSDFEKIYALF